MSVDERIESIQKWVDRADDDAPLYFDFGDVQWLVTQLRETRDEVRRELAIVQGAVGYTDTHRLNRLVQGLNDILDGGAS